MDVKKTKRGGDPDAAANRQHYSTPRHGTDRYWRRDGEAEREEGIEAYLAEAARANAGAARTNAEALTPATRG